MNNAMGLRVIAILVISTSLAGVAAGEIPSGLYATAQNGGSQQVPRADTEGRPPLVLLHRITETLREVSIAAIDNQNTRFQMSVAVGPFEKDLEPHPQAIVVAGLGLPVVSSGRQADNPSLWLAADIAGASNAEKIAAELGIKIQRRTHPGHQLLVTFRPDKPQYKPGEAVKVTMTIENVGQVPIQFMDGGSQRGARNNQFGFTAYRATGQGLPVPDTGDPSHHGGLAGFTRLAPGKVFEKSVTLSDWFKLEDPDTYRVTGMYRMEFFAPDFKYPPIWDEIAVGACDVRIEPPNTRPN